MKNIIVCITPTQMLIAEHLVQRSELEFICIVISYDDNKKYRHYINRLRHTIPNLLYYQIDKNSKFSRFFEIIKFRKFLRSNLEVLNMNFCYISSIENPFILTLLSTIKYNSLYTFDDGTANINKNSVYYRDLKISKFEKLIKKLVGINKKRDDVLLESKLHYSIYPNYSNIISNVEYIDLTNNIHYFEKFQNNELDKLVGNSCNIFIGQPIHEFSHDFLENKLGDILKSVGVQYYYPHPRERVIVNNLIYLDSEYIIEDFLAQVIKNYPNLQIKVFTFFSSAALNILNYKNVSVTCLINDFLMENNASNYKLFQENDLIIKTKLNFIP